ncbi:MAG: ABC transporter permease [Clostridiales Family XIII bacterium]|jgi:putative xylitol transport system permease protein/inositol transport system permease protein|nr:ABC transporter permease [Clostridiales Family XIII bacterium]
MVIEDLRDVTEKKSLFSPKDFFSNFGTLIGLVLVVLVITIIKPQFLGLENIFNLLRQTSINGLLALGMTFVVLTGGIDLSVGSIVGASGIYAALVAQHSELPWIVPVLVGVGIGFVLGSINGIVIARLRVPPFIATLGMLSIARGITYLASDARPVPGLSQGFLMIGGGSVGFIPIPVIILAVALVLCWLLLYRTKFGRYIYAVGGNETASKVSGVKVRSVVWASYMISGALAGLAGVVLTSRVSSGLAQAGTGYETDVIAAVVIGGTSLAGGRGRLWGTIVGFLIIGVMNNGLDMMAVSSYWQLIIKGTIIVVAAMMDSLNDSK